MLGPHGGVVEARADRVRALDLAVVVGEDQGPTAVKDPLSASDPAGSVLPRAIAEATGLEFFGIDFTIDNNGKVFIYELNASMRHSFDHAKNFPYKMPYDKNTSAAFERMVLSRVRSDTFQDIPT